MFEYYQDRKGEWRFRYKSAHNGRIIFVSSEGYKKESGVLNAIRIAQEEATAQSSVSKVQHIHKPKKSKAS